MTCVLCHDSKRVTELQPPPSGNPKHKCISVLVPCPRCEPRLAAWEKVLEKGTA